MVLGQGERLVASPSDIQNSAKYSLGLKLDSSTFLFFFLNLIFFNFFVFLKTSNINVDSKRKINDFKINALKVERVRKTFENLNSF
jgi:hypothetical protein